MDATLIRVCPVCQRLFWAKRRGKKSCWSVCRVKLWRKDNDEKYRDYYAKYDRRKAREEYRTKEQRDERERKRLHDVHAPELSRRGARVI